MPFEKLGAYLGQRGVAPTAAPFGRYFSDPSVGEENLEWEVGFPVPAEVKGDFAAPVIEMRLPVER